MVLIRAIAVILNAMLALAMLYGIYDNQGRDVGFHIFLMLLFVLNITLIWR